MQALYRLSDYLRHWARRGSVPHSQAIGLRGEDLAHRYLRRRGYTIVARNFQPRGGRAEVDLVAWDRDCLVFVEVKSSLADSRGRAPEERIDEDKREQVFRAAREWVRRAEVPWNRVRFDALTVVHQREPYIVHQRNAF